MSTKRCTKCGEGKPATREFFGSTRAGNLRGTCRTCMNARSKQYAKDNPESVRRRARERQARANKWKPSNQLKHELFIEQNGLCGLCGEPMPCSGWSDPKVLQVEHLTPVVRGGTNDRENLVLAHRTCNQEKAGKTWPEYIAWRVRVGLPLPVVK